MSELERALVALGRDLDFPATPDLTGAVRRRLVERPRQPFWRRRALVVALALLAVAVGAVLAIPDARSTIKDWLGIGNITIRYVEELPSVEKATADLGLGERVSLDEARERADYSVEVPRVDDLDDPPKVFFRAEDQQVAFLYGTEDDPRLLITQAGVGGAVEKIANLNATDTELVMVDGALGVWLSGAKHAIFYPGADQEEPFRLVGNALLFENSLGVTVRIEAEVSRDEAIRIGESMR
jgi:hypothetical protein